ncbi:hypothetical protein BG015_005299 [Linnemannia schmuckeri]|uniref:TLC domain-containing protein n=1 Tax=Linnemannia schmuckeri TaxID=64567 RepID=A0A9P5S1P9_9FUNG|nr:hypothetical protein BG015_005299 [Linnemannia schmuckeri]
MTEIMDLSTFLSRYLGFLLLCCGFHLTYFQLFRFFSPSIAKDRKRLAWVITSTTAFFVSIVAPFYTWSSMRTVFSSPTLLDTQNIGLLGNKLNHNHINYGGHHVYSAEFNSNNAAGLGQDGLRMKNNQPTIVMMDPSLLGMQKETERSIAQKDEVKQQHEVEKQHGSEEEERIGEGTHQAITEDAGDRVSKSPPPLLNKRDQEKRQFRLFFDLSVTPDDNDGTIALVVFFMAYLIMDIIMGFLYYREQVTLLAGWLHHTAYIGITYYAVTQGETFTYSMFFPMEVPTMVVGIGCLDKSLRRDMLYGFSFITFRILFDFSLTHEILWNRERDMTTILKTILIFKSLMNLTFLYGWISQQKRLAHRRRTEAAAKSSASMVATAGIAADAAGDQKIVSIIAPTITSRKSMHVQREEHRAPASHEDGTAAVASTSIESGSRRSVRIRSKGVQESDLMDTQPLIDMITVY